MKKGSHCSPELKAKLSKAKENYIPWNKGLKNCQAPNTGNFKKGQIAWNKGKSNHWVISELNPNWKGGITKVNRLIRALPQYSIWRSFIFKRDQYTCKACNKVGGDLEAHHIKKFHLIIEEHNIATTDDAIKCSVLWNTDNGITLCKECHDKTKT